MFKENWSKFAPTRAQIYTYRVFGEISAILKGLTGDDFTSKVISISLICILQCMFVCFFWRTFHLIEKLLIAKHLKFSNVNCFNSSTSLMHFYLIMFSKKMANNSKKRALSKIKWQPQCNGVFKKGPISRVNFKWILVRSYGISVAHSYSFNNVDFKHNIPVVK